MTGPRRADLVNMDRYPGEHYPIEQRYVVGLQDPDGTIHELSEERRMRCACTDDLRHPWPHR